jgi:hypothetical protein
MIFLLRKQFFEKIITEGGRELIVLNPFLDSLCNSALKNTGLAPGVPKTCFQHPQDVVQYLSFENWQILQFFLAQIRKQANAVIILFKYQEFDAILQTTMFRIFSKTLYEKLK